MTASLKARVEKLEKKIPVKNLPPLVHMPCTSEAEEEAALAAYIAEHGAPPDLTIRVNLVSPGNSDTTDPFDDPE